MAPSRLPTPETQRCRDLTPLGVITGLPALAGVCPVDVSGGGATVRASIDGSLWYGDLPAQDGVEISDIAVALCLSRIGALST